MKAIENQEGFTLIEIIVTMVILGIVLTIAGLNFKGLLWSNQVKVAVNDFVTTLGFARSEAVTRGQVVAVCRSINATAANVPGTPVPSCSTAAGAGWETGYIVFADADADGVRDANEELLRIVPGQRGGVTLTGGSANVTNVIRYAGTGFLTGSGEGVVTVSNNDHTFQVQISPTGRVRTQRP